MNVSASWPSTPMSMFFYREDGLYRYYNISAHGTLGSPIDNYTNGWDSISSLSLG